VFIHAQVRLPPGTARVYDGLMLGQWHYRDSAIREGLLVVVLVSASFPSCSHGLHTSSARDAGADGVPDVAGGGLDGGSPDSPGIGDASADGSPAEVATLSPCTEIRNCGTMTASMERRPADVLVVLDRSASMRRSLVADCLCTAGPGDDAAAVCADTAECTDRWTTMKSALLQIVGGRTDVQWGMQVFPYPADSTCSVSPSPLLAIGADAGAQAGALLDAIIVSGNTPLAPALDDATAYLSALADGNSKVILLATDGVPECPEGQPSPDTGDMADAIAASAAALRAGFPVYVLGAGPATSAMDDLARAGGTSTSYSATAPDLLSDAFASISQTSMSCTFTLQVPPPDPNNVAVYLDKESVPRDPINGWTYGESGTAIVLTGSYCDRMVSAWSAKLQVLFGCSGMAPPVCIP
jgi:hypothetical protein